MNLKKHANIHVALQSRNSITENFQVKSSHKPLFVASALESPTTKRWTLLVKFHIHFLIIQRQLSNGAGDGRSLIKFANRNFPVNNRDVYCFSKLKTFPCLATNLPPSYNIYLLCHLFSEPVYFPFVMTFSVT